MYTASIPSVKHSTKAAFVAPKTPKDHQPQQHQSTQQQQSVRNSLSSLHHVDECVDSDHGTSRWAQVEPWSTLLCRDNYAECAKAGAEGQRRSEHNQDNKLATASLGESETRAIVQDVRRTRAKTAIFRNEAVQDWLVRCVALFCQERGLPYVQGITDLAAPWAMVTDPPTLNGFSFRCFCRFVDRFAPNMFTSVPDGGVGRGGSFAALEAHLVLFEHLLRYHDPVLATHLEESRISADAYATPWFVTLFARQTPIPVVLHLWKRMLEYGDPALHQFLALAWLCSNRMLLLATSRDDVPGVVTRLRITSTEIIDDVFEEAVTLQRSTPRLFCDMLGKACYNDTARDDEVHGSLGSPGAIHSIISFIKGLRATGMVLADANQLAEILLASCGYPSATNTSGGAESDGDGVANGYGRRFVLVDCRTSGDATSSAATDAILTGAGGIGDRNVDGASIVWLRINPDECLDREPAAVEEVLREYLHPCEAEVGANWGASAVPWHIVLDASDDFTGAPCGSVQGADANGLPASWQKSNGGVHSLHGRPAGGQATLSQSLPSMTTARSGNGGSPIHVCFIGDQGSKVATGNWMFGGVKAATAAADGPAHRLARTASRLCAIPRVCVLDGGFAALQEAVEARRGELYNAAPPDGIPRGPAAGIDVCTGIAACVEDEPDIEVVAYALAAAHGDAEKVGGGGTGMSDVSLRPVETPGVSLASIDLKAVESTPLGGSGIDISGGPGAPAPPRRVTGTSTHHFERKTGRLVANSRISEPFRVYASKRADDMGRALRSLPAAAGRPLEDGARVCSFLAKGNVKTLGDSRLSLTRSLKNLEQLGVRMDGTAAGFARNFGTGLHR